MNKCKKTVNVSLRSRGKIVTREIPFYGGNFTKLI